MNTKKILTGALMTALLGVGLFGMASMAYAQTATVTVGSCNQAIADASVNPNGATTQAWFEWGTSQSLGSQTPQQTFTTSGTLSQTITGLQPSTTYYIRTVAQNQFGTAQSQIVSFNTPACGGTTQTVTVTTNPATNVSQTFATLNGFASGNGQNANAWFEWGTSQSFGNQTPQNFIGTTGFTYQWTLNNLAPNTTYYYRAVAQGTNGQLVQGNTQTFTTFVNQNTCPGGNCNITVFVTTNSATGVNDTFAILNGYVDPAGTNVTRWFEWGLGNGLGNTTVKLQQGFASTFSQSISGLQPNTTYYFRAVAQNQSGQQSFGNILTFTTTGFGAQATNIQAQTLLATNIGQTSARLNGLAIQNSNTGFNAQLSGYFEWGSTQSLGNASPSQTVGSAPSLAFYFSLFNLAPNSTYYYRAVVTDGTNIARGNIVSFTTGTQTTIVTPSRPSTTVIVGGTSKPSLMALSVDRNGACNLRGSSVEYVITYKNVSSKTLKDVALRIVLPDELSFIDSSRGTYAGADRSVVLSLGSVIPGEEGTVRLRADVARGAVIGKTTVLTAYLVDTDPATGAQEEVVAYALNGVCESGFNQGAASFFGGAGFLPTTLIGWLLLILLILALVVLARQMYGVNSTRLP